MLTQVTQQLARLSMKKSLQYAGGSNNLLLATSRNIVTKSAAATVQGTTGVYDTDDKVRVMKYANRTTTTTTAKRYFGKTGKKDDVIITDTTGETVEFDEILLSEEIRAATEGPKNNKINDDDDPFGVNFVDGTDRLGPKLPPKYKRDAMTGRFTGQIEKELSEEEKRLLHADPITLQNHLLERVTDEWNSDENNNNSTADGSETKFTKLGSAIRESDMAWNVLGRSTVAQSSVETFDDGTKLGRDDTGFTQYLTTSEFTTFQKYMNEQHEVDVTNEDIPVLETGTFDNETANTKGPKKKKKSKKVLDDENTPVDPDESELSLKWLTARAQRQMDDELSDNIYSDLMPQDLNPSRLVNRKRAKPLPVKLLHHNNVPLLHQYLTPTGQIQSRIQTRLGARDQRRVAKLIRRARAIGLLPYIGQSKVERHGWIHAKDIDTLRDWEHELIERGLSIQRKRPTKSTPTSSSSSAAPPTSSS